MQKKMRILEANIYKLEGWTNVTQTLNSHLQIMIDAQEQYSRQKCFVIYGKEKPGH